MKKKGDKFALIQIISNSNLFFRFLLFLGLTLIVVLGLFVLSFMVSTKHIAKQAEIITITENGAIIIKTSDTRKMASFLLSSNGENTCSPWVNTGIEIRKGDNITFKYSGKICLAMHRMVEAAIKDTLPSLPWTDAMGLSEDLCIKRQIRELEDKRKQLRIAPNLDQGRLIGIIYNSSASNVYPNHRPDSASVIDIPEYNKFPFEANKNGYLWLTVNEVWLDNESLSEITHDSLGLDSAIFNFIKKEKYANIWFDDNSGFFSVTIEINK